VKKYTIKDIAAKAGVSITTVSRVLNMKEEGMSLKTREKVLKVIDEMNYTPNHFARGLITNKSKLLGLIVPNINNPFFPELCRGAEDEANLNQYSLIICNSDDDATKEENYLRLLSQQQVDGILLSSWGDFPSPSTEQLERSKIPFVLLDRGGQSVKHNGVFINNEQGGYLAGRHLLDLGHRRIACVTGSANLQNASDRLAGFRRALKEENIDLPESRIISGDFHMESAYTQTKKFFEETDVTAIFASNDLMACGVYRAAYEMGLKIPKDLSIIGFDDITLVSALIPQLTTIRQDIYEMGRRAVKILIENITNETNETVIFQPTLIVRESTYRIPQESELKKLINEERDCENTYYNRY
jgi:LacI family transcriptional regulator